MMKYLRLKMKYLKRKSRRIGQKLLLLLLLLAFILVMNSGLTWSYFSDQVLVNNNTFSAGTW